MIETCEALKKYDDYLGLTKIPEDFDEFWESRMAEADAVSLRYELLPCEIPDFHFCNARLLRFQGIAGSIVYAKVLIPQSEEKVPLVLQFHGYPGAARSWLEQCSYPGMGCAVIAMECPGQGGPGKDAGGYVGPTVSGHIIAGLDGEIKDMYYVRLYQTIRILCRIVKKLPGIDLSRIFVSGGSQGGAQGVACCALNTDLINRAAILYPFLSDFRLIWELDADMIAYEGLRYYSRWFDPDGSKLDEVFRRLSYIDTVSFAHLVKCPVLFGTGLADQVCPPQSQCAVYNQLDCVKKRVLFPGKGHEEIQDFDDMLLDFFGRREAEL